MLLFANLPSGARRVGHAEWGTPSGARLMGHAEWGTPSGARQGAAKKRITLTEKIDGGS